MEEIIPALVAAAAKKALEDSLKPEGKRPSVHLGTEMEAVIAKLPDKIDSPKEFAEYMKIIDGVTIKEIDIGIYCGKRIRYKDK